MGKNIIYEPTRKHVYDASWMPYGANILMFFFCLNPSIIVPFIIKEGWGTSDE